MRPPACAALVAIVLTCLPGLGLAGQTSYVEIPTIVVIYTHYYYSPTVRLDLTSADVATLQQQVAISQRFLWRSSHLKHLLKPDYLIVDRTLTTAQLWDFGGGAYWLPFWRVDGATSVVDDLHNAGITDGQYSVVLVLYAFQNTTGAGAAIGGGTYGPDMGCMGDAAYVGIPLAWGLEVNGVVTHEYLHAIDSLFYWTKPSDPAYANVMHHADQPSTFPYVIDCGQQFNFMISAVIDPSWWFRIDPKWVNTQTAPDADNDGVPDSGALPITEQNLGTSSTRADTDADGLNDLDELMATFYGGTSPLVADSDADGLADGADPYPMYVLNDHVNRSAPTLDGVIQPTEYTRIVRFNEGNTDIAARAYAAWNGSTLYFAADVTDEMRSVYYDGPWWSDAVSVRIDVQHDGWFWRGNDNYRFILVPRGSGLRPDTYGLLYSDAEHELDMSSATSAYRTRSGGYVVEVALPTTLMPGLSLAPGASVRLTFDVEDYDTYGAWPVYNLFTGRSDDALGFVELHLTGPRGDANCDNVVDFDDINPFVLALTSPAGYAASYPDCAFLNCDVNGDGAVGFGDINPFVALLVR